MSTWGDIVNDALLEINAVGIDDPVEAEDSQLAIRKLNRILDQWAARKVFAYDVAFGLYTLTPNHQPHLIGPGLTSPDFAAANRPVRIESASLVLTNSTPNAVDVPINVRDDAWWAAQSLKSLATTFPTDLYYSPAVPNGQLFFWPIPTIAYQVRLEMWSVITAVPLDSNGNPDLTQAFVAAPAYENALTLTLAEESCDVYGRPMPASLPGRALRARRALQTNNIASPAIASADYGSGSRKRSGFNFYTGQPA